MTFANVPEVLVNVRVGKDMYQRRGSWKYFKSEAKLQWYMFRNRIISLPLFTYNVLIRFMWQVVTPNWFRGLMFQKFAREK